MPEKFINEKIIIFGAAECGERAFHYLGENNEIIAFADNSKDKQGGLFCGISVISPSKIKRYKAKTVVALYTYFDEVCTQLIGEGISDIYLFQSYIDASSHKECCLIEKVKGKRNISFETKRLVVDTANQHFQTNQRVALMFANFFPPMSGGGVQRPLKFAKYLGKYGYKVIVVTKGYTRIDDAYDTELLSDIEGVQIVRIQDKPEMMETISDDKWNHVESMVLGAIESSEVKKRYNELIQERTFLGLPDDYIVWAYDCISQVDEMVCMQDISVVYTTGCPFSTFLIGFYLKRKYGIKWVMDYRDPWTMNSYYNSHYYNRADAIYDIEREIERTLLKQADKILVVSEYFRKDYFELCDIKKIMCITNGVDEDDFKGIIKERSKKFSIVYNGALYAERNPSAIIKAISELIDESKVIKDDIRFIINGDISNAIRKEMNISDVYGIVVQNGFIGHTESLKMVINAQMLIVFGAYGEGAYGGWTGKFFEYLYTGNPIISFSESYGVHYDTLSNTKNGITVKYDDITSLKAFIRKVYDEWKSSGNVSRNSDNIEQFKRSNLTKQLAMCFDEITQN